MTDAELLAFLQSCIDSGFYNTVEGIIIMEKLCGPEVDALREQYRGRIPT